MDPPLTPPPREASAAAEASEAWARGVIVVRESSLRRFVETSCRFAGAPREFATQNVEQAVSVWAKAAQQRRSQIKSVAARWGVRTREQQDDRDKDTQIRVLLHEQREQLRQKQVQIRDAERRSRLLLSARESVRRVRLVETPSAKVFSLLMVGPRAETEEAEAKQFRVLMRRFVRSTPAALLRGGGRCDRSTGRATFRPRCGQCDQPTHAICSVTGLPHLLSDPPARQRAFCPRTGRRLVTAQSVLALMSAGAEYDAPPEPVQAPTTPHIPKSPTSETRKSVHRLPVSRKSRTSTASGGKAVKTKRKTSEPEATLCKSGSLSPSSQPRSPLMPRSPPRPSRLSGSPSSVARSPDGQRPALAARRQRRRPKPRAEDRMQRQLRQRLPVSTGFDLPVPPPDYPVGFEMSAHQQEAMAGELIFDALYELLREDVLEHFIAATRSTPGIDLAALGLEQQPQ